jgi:hypothetical protein
MTKDAQAPAAPRRGAASAPAAPGKATFSDDIVAAFREVQASGSALVKDEFESTAQYHARLRSLKGKGETKKYVFIVEKDRDNYTFEYNADAEQMHLTVGTKYLVSDTVQLRSIQTVLGTYVGTNAFGVKKIITRTVEDTYYVSLSSSSPFRLFGKDPYDMFEPAMFTWAMDPAAAKATKEYLRIAVVGTVPSPELATEEKGIRDPTIDDPRQSLICSRTLPFF